VAFIIFGLVCSILATVKRKKIQGLADENFKTKNGNYQFYYSIKCIKKEEDVVVKIFTEPVLGFSDLSHAQTNDLQEVDIFVNDTAMVTTMEKKGLAGMSEFILPSEYIDNGEINVDFTVKTTWFLGGKQIEDTLKFTYQKKL
jgi:hypothetical protein